MSYAIGDRVTRLEDRDLRGAVVEHVAQGPGGEFLRLAYDEGGGGWWPAAAVEPEALP